MKVGADEISVMHLMNVTGEVDDFDLAVVANAANLTLSVENCTAIYGNVTLAEAENVTCLAHAPVRTTQVSRNWNRGRFPSFARREKGKGLTLRNFFYTSRFSKIGEQIEMGLVFRGINLHVTDKLFCWQTTNTCCR